MNQYPEYLKSIDPDGNTSALICKEKEGKIIVLQPVTVHNKTTPEVQIRQVPNEDELKAIIGGLVVPCSSDDYNETLFTKWAFDGSNVYRAQEGQDNVATSEQQPAAGSELTDNPANETDGSTAPVEPGNADGNDAIDNAASGAVELGEGAEPSNAEPVVDAGTSDGNDLQGSTNTEADVSDTGEKDA